MEGSRLTLRLYRGTVWMLLALIMGIVGWFLPDAASWLASWFIDLSSGTPSADQVWWGLAGLFAVFGSHVTVTTIDSSTSTFRRSRRLLFIFPYWASSHDFGGIRHIDLDHTDGVSSETALTGGLLDEILTFFLSPSLYFRRFLLDSDEDYGGKYVLKIVMEDRASFVCAESLFRNGLVDRAVRLSALTGKRLT